MTHEQRHLTFAPNQLFLLQLKGALLLVGLHVLAMLTWYLDWIALDDRVLISFFDLDEEESFGTWFSAINLFIAGCSTLLFVRLTSGPLPHLIQWYCLAFGLIFMSIDEVAAMHEYLNSSMVDGHWTEIGAIFVAILGILYIPFLRSLPTRTRNLCLLAGIVFLGGAIGVEWGTIYHEDQGLLDTLGYNLWNAVEEGFEMIGVIIYQYALLDFAKRSHSSQLRLSLHPNT